MKIFIMSEKIYEWTVPFKEEIMLIYTVLYFTEE